MEQKTLLTTVIISNPVNNLNSRLQVLVCLIACLLTSQIVSAQNFRAEPITHPDGSFNAVTLNNLAQIAGTVFVNDSTYHAVRREQDGQFTNLPELGGNLSQAIGMNELGEVIGYTLDENGFGHVVVWESNGFRELEVPADASFVPIPLDLNNSGVVTGYYIDASSLRHALVWDTNGVVQYLPEGSGNQSSPSAINEADEVAGTILLADGTARAYLWQPNSNTKSILSTQLDDYTGTDIGTLGGAGAQALDINNQGEIVGMANFSPHSQFVHAFVWQDGVMVDLGTLGGDNSRANSINDDGIIVGRSLISDSTVTKSDRLSLQQGLLSNLFKNSQAEDQFFPVHPMNLVNAPNEEEYDGFLADSKWRWNIANLEKMIYEGTTTDIDDAISINLDLGFLSWDEEAGFNVLISNFLYVDPNASGGSWGYHFLPFPNMNVPFADNPLPGSVASVFVRDGIHTGVVSGISPRALIISYRGLGETLNHNPGNSDVTFNGPFTLNGSSSASFIGNQDDLRTFNDNVEINGMLKIKPGIIAEFRKEIHIGPEGSLETNSRNGATTQLTIFDRILGLGFIRLTGDGTTQLNLNGDMEVKLEVEQEERGQAFVKAIGYLIGDINMKGGNLVANSDISQSAKGMLELEQGQIMLHNQKWLIMKSDPGAITGGSPDSYFSGGELWRGISTAGTYNYPVGDDLSYNPAFFNFENDLNEGVNMGVNYGTTEDLNLSFKEISVFVPEFEREVNLDVLADGAWGVQANGPVLQNPRVRVENNGLKNVLSVHPLILVSFDKDGKMVGPAGSDPTQTENVITDGVLSISQPDVTLGDGMHLAIATNKFTNPFDRMEDDFARVQMVNLSSESQEVDIYYDNMNINFPINVGQGTPYGGIPAGNRVIDFVDANDQDNSNPIASKSIDIDDGLKLNLVLVPTISETTDIIKFEARLEAAEKDKVDINFIHLHRDKGPIDISMIVNGEPIIIGENIDFGNSSGYTSVVPGLAEIPILDYLFSYKTSSRSGEKLDIYLVPKILDNNKSSLRNSEDDFDLIVLDALGLKIEPTEVTSVEESTELPIAFSLHANYPNPFSHSTMIRYELPQASLVRLTVNNLLGQPVRTLVNAQQQSGYHTVEFDSLDESGKELASGLYLLRIEVGNTMKTRTMMLIK